MNLTYDDLTFVAVVALICMSVWACRASYWKARAELLESMVDRETEKNDDGGWAEEARFWRRHFDKDAAEAVE